MIKYVVAVTIFRFLRECIFVPLANKKGRGKEGLIDRPTCCFYRVNVNLYCSWILYSLISTDIALIAQSYSFNLFYTKLILPSTGEKDALALYRHSQFHGPPAISSKPGALGEEHIHTIMETIQEHIMVEREHL